MALAVRASPRSLLAPTSAARPASAAGLRVVAASLVQQPLRFASLSKRQPKGHTGPVPTYRSKNPPEWYKRIPFPAQKRFLVRRYDEIFRTSPLLIAFQHHNSDERHAALRVELNPFVRIVRVKSTLAKMAVWDTPLQSLTGLFNGPTDIAFVETEGVDIMAALKAFLTAHKDDPTIILGGTIYGRPLTYDMMQRLAALPDHDYAMAELITVLNQPARQLIQVLNNPSTNLVKVLKFISGPQEEDAAPETASES